MVIAMTASQLLKNSTYLLSALLLAACQPSPSTDEPAPVDNNATAETPLVITDDSVTMTSDHILSIKPSRYQPSIGLQGNLEPVKQSDFIAAYPVNVVEVLVTEGQLVEKGMPLLIVRRMHTDNSTDLASEAASQERELASDVNGTEQSDKQVKDANPSSKSAQPATAGSTAITESGSADDKDVSSLSINADNDNLTDDTVGKDTNTEPQYNLVTVRASFKGRIGNLRAKTGQKLAARTPLLQLSDETQLYFVATLPIQAEPQLSIGQTVNFTAEGVSDNFTGQVSKLTATSQPKKLLVYVDVIENKTSRDNLMPNMQVTGRVNYGQIDVGTIVPKRALHDVDLTELQTHPYKPLRPLTANVWIIGQDQRLMQRPIEVVEYDPLTKQYLIAGISNDSLICLADLPVDSKGKKVIVS